MKNEEAQNLIENHKGILLGSRAFNVQSENSDWDVAIMATDLPDNYLNEYKFDISRYFNILPLRNAWLIKTQDLDVLVFEDRSDYNSIKNAVEDLKTFPKYFLETKHNRIKLFEIALSYYGFKPKTKTHDDMFDDDVAF